MQGALTQEYLESFEEAQHSRRRSGPQNHVANFQDIILGHRALRRDQGYLMNSLFGPFGSFQHQWSLL